MLPATISYRVTTPVCLLPIRLASNLSSASPEAEGALLRSPVDLMLPKKRHITYVLYILRISYAPTPALVLRLIRFNKSPTNDHLIEEPRPLFIARPRQSSRPSHHHHETLGAMQRGKTGEQAILIVRFFIFTGGSQVLSALSQHMPARGGAFNQGAF